MFINFSIVRSKNIPLLKLAKQVVAPRNDRSTASARALRLSPTYEPDPANRSILL
ncbi:hypothetical protein ABIE89_000165 [Bradyrhizobium niftali]|uniref:hypothetical protein n=1 Tax=Bradyrhizobium niftali TaxID=2560055 RepID=UPI003835A3CB